MRRIGLPLAIVAVGLLLGCTKKGPEVCDHIRTLLEEGGEHTVRPENHQRCIDEAAARRIADPSGFHRIESCILAARTLETVSLCGF